MVLIWVLLLPHDSGVGEAIGTKIDGLVPPRLPDPDPERMVSHTNQEIINSGYFSHT